MKRAVSGEISSKLDAEKLLQQQAEAGNDGCLEVSHGSVIWYFYLERGQLVYATYSVDPIDLLDNHLRRLSRQVQSLTNEIRTQVRINFTAEIENTTTLRPDYQAISWLVLTKHLHASEAATLIITLSKEILESYLPLTEGSFKFIPKNSELPVYCRLDIQTLLQDTKQRLRAWNALGPKIWSPYQRPKLSNAPETNQKYASAQIQKLQKILRGFSFRHLGVLLNLDELKLAQNLYPLIQDEVVLLSDPQPPFDQLPRFVNGNLDLQPDKQQKMSANHGSSQAKNIDNISVSQKQYTIACIDDSPSILNTINRYLQGQDISVVMINDPVKALVQIIRVKPDLILLDVGMPWVDGYELCRLIRKNSQFKKTPVVMVTGNTGLINRGKAKVAGATDYMTKPFTQSDLLKMVFRHLT